MHGGLTVDRQREEEENQDAREQRESPASREKGRFPPPHGRLAVVASDEGGTSEKILVEFGKRAFKKNTAEK